MTAPGTNGDAHHRRAWELLLSDDALRAEYLRLTAAGITSSQKREFFDRVVEALDERR